MTTRFLRNSVRRSFETLESRHLLTVGPELLMDLNTASLGATPLDALESETLVVNDIVYFRANDGINGFELFRSDGTADGTWMVKDVAPGGASSKPYGFHRIGNEFFFVAGQNPQHLWRSDGTAGGTSLVMQLTGEVNSAADMLSLNGQIFVVAGAVLHTVDRIGARPVASGVTDRPVIFNGAVYYARNRSSLWSYDLENNWEREVKTLSGDRELQNLTVAGHRLYFTWGSQLWTSDGNPEGTLLLQDFDSIAVTNSPRLLTAMGSELYFAPVLNQGQKTALWKSDGTVAGTMQFSPVAPYYHSGSRSMVVFKDHLAFSGRLKSSDPIQFWKSDGTAEGTTLISSMESFPTIQDNRSWVAEWGDYLYFTGHNPPTGWELWRTDLTAEGTQLVSDVRPGLLSSAPDAFSATSSRLFFFADPPRNGRELYSSDGTADGTGMVKDINNQTYSSKTREFVRLGDKLLFVADNGPSGLEVFRTDGTATGTQLTRDIRANENDSDPAMLTVAGDLVYFTAYTTATGVELWKSDGTRTGTRQVTDLWPGPSSFRLKEFTNIGGRLFFQLEGDGGVPELWSSDGSPGGTVRIRRFDEYVRRNIENFSYIKRLADANGLAFFAFEDQEHGNELWVSDGTEVGTRLVKDIREGTASGLSGSAILSDGGVVYFSSTDGELWRSDGTADGTYQVADFPESSAITQLHAVIDGIVYFNVINPDLGHELFRSDGTPEGTWLVKDIQLGPAFGSPREMVEWNGMAYFVANERDNGGEIWRTDGTPEGTWQVTDVVAGPSGPNISELTPVGDRLYFIVQDQHGRRLWQTGASFESTSPVTTYQFPAVGATEPLPPWSNPDNLIELNGMLIYTGDTTGIGNEPWRIKQDVDSNSAPIMEDGTAVALGTISEDAPSNAGSLLADLLRGQDGGPMIADSDANSIVGIAVIGADNLNGRWQFTLDAGSHWFDFGTASESDSRLLMADYRTRIRFAPSPDFAGAISGGLQFRAWDATTGIAGGTANATSFGGATAFSEGIGTASITIDEVNDAPTVLDDVVTVRQGVSSVVIDVLLNDSVTPDVGETVTLTSVTQPAQGGVATVLDNKIELTVAELFLGDMVFTYTATDSRGASAVGNVLVRVALRGDANFDQRVDVQDLNAVRNAFGSSGLGDVNDDGVVNVSDLNDVRNHFGTPIPAATSRHEDVVTGQTNKSIEKAADLVFEMLASDRRGFRPLRRLASLAPTQGL